MARENPFRCFYHDWNGFGRCPRCRQDAWDALTVEEQFEVWQKSLIEKGQGHG